MKINICQFNYKTLDIELNKNQILNVLDKSNNDVLNVFSEMSLTGYPLYKSILYNDIFKQTSYFGDILCKSGKSFIIGTPVKDDDVIYNSLVFVEKGEVKALACKNNLSRFDEGFSAGNGIEVIEYEGKKIAFGFYEDIKIFIKKKISVDIVIICTNTLFDKDYKGERIDDLKFIARKIKASIVYVNRIGGEGSFIFVGESFVLNANGELAYRLSEFEPQQQFLDTEKLQANKNLKALCYEERIYNACVLGLRDYFHKNHIYKAVIGLSGGIDSAVVLVLGVAALGKENITGILLPSVYSTEHSILDAQKSADNLGINSYTIHIKGMFDASLEALQPILKDTKQDTTEENLQARSRLMVIMAFANKIGAAMLNTSNKSESSVGYGTLYGDDSGALGPIGDLFKEDVYRLARWINRDKEIIPWNSINKAPSAELHAGQKDTDSLPEYDVLDKIMRLHLEQGLCTEEIIQQGIDEKDVNRVMHLFRINEWKRHQEAPVLRLSSTCFTTDYHIPMS